MNRIKLAIIFCLAALTSAAYDFCEQNIYYRILSDSEVAVTHKGTNTTWTQNSVAYWGNVNIPSTVWHNGNTYKVTEIGWNAFQYCQSLTSVTLPNTLTKISSSAFCRTGLKTITIPASVESVAQGAFAECVSMESFYGKFASADHRCLISDGVLIAFAPKGVTNYEIPSTVTELANSVFASCSELAQVNIPNGVTTIGYGAFSQCKGLTEITIPESVTTIYGDAFFNCSSLARLYFNAVNCSNELSYSTSYFGVCDNLTTIVFGDRVTKIPDYLFSGCTAIQNIEIPPTVTKIGRRAFYGCKGLTKITIPDTVTEMGMATFSGCSNLADVRFSDSLTEISNSTFADCTSLASIEIPASINTIWHGAFQGCTSLTDITLPRDLTTLGQRVFTGCSSLTSIRIPDSVETIQYGTFENCTALTEVTLSSSLTTIESDAFRGCSSLADIKLPDSISEIGSSAFLATAIYNDTRNWDNNVFYIDNYLIKANYYNTKGDYVIRAGTRLIAKSAFSSCSNLTSVTFPNSIRSIGENAFLGCSNLRAVYGKYTSDDNRCLIMDNVLELCALSGLTEFSIPENVDEIAVYALQGCGSLTKIYFPPTLKKVRDMAFGECYRLTRVDISDLAAWCNVEFDLNYSNPLTYAHNLYVNGELLTELTIPEGIKAINVSAFKGCQSLRSVVIPSSVEKISSSAFEGCTSLQRITLPSSINEMGSFVIYGCSDIREIYAKMRNPMDITTSSQVFDNVPTSSCTLFVPEGTRELYASHYQWKKFTNIVEMDFSTPGDCNGDEKIDTRDISLMIDFILGNDNGRIDERAADINYDGDVNAADISLIINLIIGQ